VIDEARMALTRYYLRCVNRRQRIEALLISARQREQDALGQIQQYDSDLALTVAQVIAGANVARRRNIVKGRRR
jgi:hypothetical protein